MRLTPWGQSVAALALTLLAIGSWSYVARTPAEPHRLSEAEAGGILAGTAEGQPDEAPLRSFSLAAAGDILIHEPVAVRAAANAAGGAQYDFGPMFEHVAPLISEVDLGICHMETPISRDNSDVASYPIFNAPREIADALAGAGFDLCSTASNHSFDKGSVGVRATLDVLRDAGLRTEGTAGNPSEARRPELLEVNDVEVGHLSYTYGLNGFKLPSEEQYLVDMLEVPRILRDAERAKAKGAEFVVVSLHWGQEFQTAVTPDQLEGAKRLLRSKAIDLILGHHAHVPQAIKKVGKEFVIFGLGNFISNQRPGATATCCLPETQDGLLVRLDVEETDTGWRSSVTYGPTWVRPGTYEIVPVGVALDDPVFAAERDALSASWERTVTTVESMGARRAGVRPADAP